MKPHTPTPSSIVSILTTTVPNCLQPEVSLSYESMMKSKGRRKLNSKNQTPLTTATPTEFSAPSSIKIQNFSILFTVGVGTQLLSLGISESESLFKMCMAPSLEVMVSPTAEWTYSQPHGDRMTSFSNGSRESANSTKI